MDKCQHCKRCAKCNYCAHCGLCNECGLPATPVRTSPPFPSFPTYPQVTPWWPRPGTITWTIPDTTDTFRVYGTTTTVGGAGAGCGGAIDGTFGGTYTLTDPVAFVYNCDHKVTS